MLVCIEDIQLYIINGIKQHALICFLERDKVRRQFKIFRESKEREIQDVLQAKREVELQFQHYLSVVSHDENRSEVVGNGNMHVDWWAPSLESDAYASVDSLTQVTSFRGPEFFHSPLEREGPFTNISRGTMYQLICLITY